LDPNKFLLEEIYSFSFAKNTPFFTLIVQWVFSFSRTTFSFHFLPSFLFRSCFIFASRCIWTSGLCLYSSKKLFKKKVRMVLEKRKVHAKKWYKRSLFRLRLRLLHAMLDVILIVCLVIFAVAWLVSNDWDCFMSLWKNHALFLFCGSIYLVFSFDALFGLTWRMLTTCLTQTSRHKTLWSFSFWLLMSFYASLNDVLSLCMIMAIFALLVGHSQSFASPHFVLSMSSAHASNSQKPSYSNVSTIHTY
jgi:hypothetical protein